MNAFYYSATIADFTSPKPEPVISICGCGIKHTVTQWAYLPLVGYMLREDGWDRDLELRNCSCRSTLAVRKEKVCRVNGNALSAVKGS